MAIGKCLRCDKVTEMTQDHVIPDWFNKALVNFELKNLQANVIELVCQKCNNHKAGKLILSDPRVMKVMKEFLDFWIKEVRKHEEYKP